MLQTFDGAFDGTFDGTLDGTLARTFDGTFNRTLDGTFDVTFDGTFDDWHGSSHSPILQAVIIVLYSLTMGSSHKSCHNHIVSPSEAHVRLVGFDSVVARDVCYRNLTSLRQPYCSSQCTHANTHTNTDVNTNANACM